MGRWLTGFLLGFMVTGSTFAADVMSYGEWKDRQIVSAMNRQVRAANQLRLIRIGNETPNRELEKSLISELISLGNAVEMTKSLTLEDYFLFYLKPLNADGVPLREAARKLSADQVEELLRLMIQDRESETRRTSFTGSRISPRSAANIL